MTARPVAKSPCVAFAMGRQVLSDDQLDRLDLSSRVLDRLPLTDFTSDRAIEVLAEAELLVTSWGCPPLDAEALERAPRLRAVVHAAGTVKPILPTVAWDRGLQVSSAADANALPVAEYTLATILYANKGVFRLADRYRALRDTWHWPADTDELGNYDKIVGVVGASRVGRRVVQLLAAFDLEVLVYDPTVNDEDLRTLGARGVSLVDLLTRSDVVSLHAPALPSTRHLLDREALGYLRDGATLINSARGTLVDPEALIDELCSGRLYAILDTTEPEPLPSDSVLWQLDNVVLTPHVAGAKGVEIRRVAGYAVKEVERWVRGEPFSGGVTPEALDRLA